MEKNIKPKECKWHRPCTEYNFIQHKFYSVCTYHKFCRPNCPDFTPKTKENDTDTYKENRKC